MQEKLFVLKQENEKEQREFKKRNRENKLRVADLEFMYKITVERVKELENSNKILSIAFKNSIIKNKGIKIVENILPKYIYQKFSLFLIF